MKKLVFDSKIILEKKFKPANPGYDPLEVDLYLDQIIKDYITIEENCALNDETLSSLKNKIKKLEKDNSKLTIELEKYKTRIANVKPDTCVTTDNMQLLKKISALEKFVYDLGYDPTKIK